jgi:hypothetical protein
MVEKLSGGVVRRKVYRDGILSLDWGSGSDISPFEWFEGSHTFTSVPARIDEMAIWLDPSLEDFNGWDGILSALYNDGIGTVYRSGQWWEVAE